MNIKPTNNKVFIKVDKLKSVVDIPDEFQEKRGAIGRVIAGKWKGKRVVFNKCTDIQIEMEGEKVSILKESDIIATVKGKGVVLCTTKPRNYTM